jgi:hypothetical protein
MIGLAGRLVALVGFVAAPALAGSYTGCVVQLTRECTTDFGSDINIYYGTAQLFSPAHALLSTTTAITVDLAPGPNVANQIAADPTAPAFVAANITSLIGNTDMAVEASIALNPDTTGLGNLFTELGLTVDPVINLNADQALVTALTTQSVPFTVTGDTGFTYFTGPDPNGFQYLTASANIIARAGGTPLQVGQGFGPYSLNGVSYDFIGVTDVNFVERDFQLTETSTAPEPGSWMLVATCIVLSLGKISKSSWRVRSGGFHRSPR